MQNLISKHIHNNEPLDWKDCNLSVIIKSLRIAHANNVLDFQF